MSRRSKCARVDRRARAGARGRSVLSVVGSGLAVVTLVGAGALVGIGAGPAGGAAKTTSTTCASAPTKCYLVTLSTTPTSVKAGTKATFTFKVTDEAPHQTLGSLKITVPAIAGYSITRTGVTGPKGSTLTATTTTVVFKTLDIAPGTWKFVTIRATVPCVSGTYTWTTAARQSNQFNGPPGNFMVLTGNSKLSGTISGSCTLEFTNEPKGTRVGNTITTTFGTASGTPIEVGVVSTGTLLTTFAGTVTVSLVGGPTGATLSGTTVVTHSSGSAMFTFRGLSIGTPGIGYQLEAKSGAFSTVAAVYSSPFSIYQTLTKCTGVQCSGSASGKTVTLSSTATNSSSTGFLGLGFGTLPGFTKTSCGTYTIALPSTDTANFEVLNKTGTAAQTPGTWKVVVEISKTIVQTKKLHRTSPNSWELCYASTTPFTATGTLSTFTVPTRTTSPATTTYYYGLLPSCSNTPVAPCVLSKTKDGAGDVLLTFLATGDPAGRF